MLEKLQKKLYKLERYQPHKIKEIQTLKAQIVEVENASFSQIITPIGFRRKKQL